MCIDYRDLNRASPNDNFSLPHIDTLVNHTARHSIFSFIDGFLGYNQIKMAQDDMEKLYLMLIKSALIGTTCSKKAIDLILNGRIVRWQVMFLEYDIIYVTQKTIKRSAVAEFLVDCAIKNYEPMNLKFSDEDVMAIEENEPVEES
ncbi:uncharacterized protein LOC111294732 [Durio zibethinus]|uniref:Uncharacterized protein LOC111294732 n=1 Tax=Durio zibethinus TaxID=66656 RepID=A0A6P5YTJ3_DURZI|nr:uncharacterized protein LOC111294732 [Durio zibethinus]